MPAVNRKIVAGVLCRFVWFGLCASLILSARAHPSTNEMSFAGLAVLPGQQVRLTGRNQADFDCGKVNAIDHPQIEQRFTLRNEAETPLAITALETTCHCTTAVVEKIAGKSSAPGETSVYYLPPGEELVIKLTVQLVRQPSGPFSHGVAIRADGHENPIARLHLAGVMDVSLMVTPGELDFGRMKRGESHSLTLTILCDPRLLSNGALPRLEVQGATGAGQTATHLFKIVPQAESSSAKPAPSDSALRTKTYIVTVQTKQLGELNARLAFEPVGSADYTGTIPHDRALAIFSGVTIPVCGEVVGK